MRSRSLRQLSVIVLGLFWLAGCSNPSGEPLVRPRPSGSALFPGDIDKSRAFGARKGPVVERVVDGDTIIARPGGRVRLIGIDTPESVDPRRPVQCFGVEASNRTKKMLPAGTVIELRMDVEHTDRYGRTLAYVFRRSDGLFINLELVREGYARVYTFPPNVAHVDEFLAAERDARTHDRGLWAASTCSAGR